MKLALGSYHGTEEKQGILQMQHAALLLAELDACNAVLVLRWMCISIHYFYRLSF